jgi:hypothetical protein
VETLGIPRHPGKEDRYIYNSYKTRTGSPGVEFFGVALASPSPAETKKVAWTSRRPRHPGKEDRYIRNTICSRDGSWAAQEIAFGSLNVLLPLLTLPTEKRVEVRGLVCMLILTA